MPDVNIQQGKYGIRLSVPSMDGMSDLWLRCDHESQYAQWMAACRVAAKGKSLADITFDQVKIGDGKIVLKKLCVSVPTFADLLPQKRGRGPFIFCFFWGEGFAK